MNFLFDVFGFIYGFFFRTFTNFVVFSYIILLSNVTKDYKIGFWKMIF